MIYNPFAIIVAFVLATLIALIGDKRKIGGFWPFFFSLTFTPIIGLIIALSSKKLSKYSFKLKDDSPKISTTNLILSILLIIIGLAGAIGCLMPNLEGDDLSGSVPFAIGLIGWGIYIIMDKPVVSTKLSWQKKDILKTHKAVDTATSQKTNPLDSIKGDEAYSLKSIHTKLSTSIPLMLITLEENKKIDFLNMYLQPKHNNPFNDDFLTKFPDCIFQSENNWEYLKDKFNTIEFQLELNNNDINISSINLYLQGISSPQEIFRMFAVIYAVREDRKNSDIMIKNAIYTWSTTGKIPNQYLHLIRLTEIKLLIYFQDFDKLSESLLAYKKDFDLFYTSNPQYTSLEKRFYEFF